MRKIEVGERYGKWTVIARSSVRVDLHYTWLCRCDCGTERSIRPGMSECCGCLNKRSLVHGGTGTPEYNVWAQMKARCFNNRHKSFAGYGGRGITVCPEWRHSFQAFIRDVGTRPGPKYTLDRINNNGNYEPDNCRWATMRQQGNNTRVNKRLTFNGETLTVTEWARRAMLKPDTLWHRIYSRGWSVEMAISSPLWVGPTDGAKASA